jgi:hypothetical protein
MMAEYYYSPVLYGIHDVTASGSSGQFGLRVYYPSDDGAVWEAPIRPDDYPLIVFAHGDRSSEPGLCPADRTQDYQLWSAVLHLWARCGFVVAAPAVHDVIHSVEATAARIEDTVKWMRGQWVGSAVLHYPPVFTEAIPPPGIAREAGDYPTPLPPPAQLIRWPPFHRPPFPQLGLPTPLGLIGHSWGARGCALAATRGVVVAKAIGSVAGTWDDNAAITALTGAGLPTALLAGTDDLITLSFMQALWNSLPVPKHQVALQGLGHWDWFGGQGGIHPCDGNAPRPACPVGWQIASEVILAFVTKYLRGHWWRPPYLLGSPGGRPPLMPWFEPPAKCALKARWDDPTASTSLGNPGEVTLGTWTDSSPW